MSRGVHYMACQRDLVNCLPDLGNKRQELIHNKANILKDTSTKITKRGQTNKKRYSPSIMHLLHFFARSLISV